MPDLLVMLVGAMQISVRFVTVRDELVMSSGCVILKVSYLLLILYCPHRDGIHIFRGAI
jgi:hypothetical protein